MEEERKKELVETLIDASSTWLLGMALENSAEKDVLKPENIISKNRVLTPEGGEFKFHLKGMERKNLIGLMKNNKSYLTGICLAVFYEVLSEIFPNTHKHGNEEIRNAITSIYMLRCSYAHSPKHPKWEVRGPIFTGIFEIKSINWRLDTTSLHNTPVNAIAWGGWIQLLRLFGFCTAKVKEELNFDKDNQIFSLNVMLTVEKPNILIEFKKHQ